MTPMLGILASQISGHLASPTSFDSIQTVTVGSGGQASITFSSIPSTYKHLQVRAFAQVTRATYGREGLGIRVGNGSIDSGTNYSWHFLDGDGASATASAGSTVNTIEGSFVGTTTGGTYGVAIIDFLEYANTNIYKTVRNLGGLDHNGTIAGYGGMVNLHSGSWRSTSAINQISIYGINSDSFTQYSSFALYGVKG